MSAVAPLPTERAPVVAWSGDILDIEALYAAYGTGSTAAAIALLQQAGVHEPGSYRRHSRYRR